MDDELLELFDEIDTLLETFDNILENVEDLDPEYIKMVDDNFWDLI